MYKTTQDKRDWMARVASHSDRPVLHANVQPRKFAQFEEGRLASLRDERARLLQQIADHGPNHSVHHRLGAIAIEIKRLNREAAESTERALLWQAAREALDDATFEKFNQRVIWLRMRAEGASDAEIDEALSTRRGAK